MYIYIFTYIFGLLADQNYPGLGTSPVVTRRSPCRAWAGRDLPPRTPRQATRRDIGCSFEYVNRISGRQGRGGGSANFTLARSHPDEYLPEVLGLNERIYTPGSYQSLHSTTWSKLIE